MKRTLFALALMAAAPASAAELRIGLQDDPDTLDPAKNWSLVGRQVLQSMCDKLVDIAPDQTIIPMLATKWDWADDLKTLTLTIRKGAVFHDGEPVDAEAVKFSLDRALTMPDSRRKAEIAVIDKIETTGDDVVKISLKEPSVPLLAQFADRAGIIVSPKAVKAAGDANFGNNPVCAGPYKFVERKTQDFIRLDKFDKYYDAARFSIDTLRFVPMPDSTVRYANLQSNQLQLIERLAPTDVPSIEGKKGLKVAEAPGLGYHALTFNIANGEGANPLIAKNPEVRQAISLLIQREALNQVVWAGHNKITNQPFSQGSPYYDPSQAAPRRDVAAAKAMLAKAGADKLSFTLLTPTDPQRQQVAQMIQAMLAEGGIEMKIQTTELITILDQGKKGAFQAHLVGWSGRIDPDGNLAGILSCNAPGNDGKYCNPELDAKMAEARRVPEPAKRKVAYAEVVRILQKDVPLAYLYDLGWIFAFTSKLEGFKAYPDGIIRLADVKLAS